MTVLKRHIFNGTEPIIYMTVLKRLYVSYLLKSCEIIKKYLIKHIFEKNNKIMNKKNSFFIKIFIINVYLPPRYIINRTSITIIYVYQNYINK